MCRPILDLRVLNHALHKLPFKMMTRKRIFGCVYSDRPEGHVLSWLNPTATQGIPAIRVRGSCMSVQDPAFRAPQPVGFSGQLGKEQTPANAEDLFSRHGVGFGQPDSTPHPVRAQSVLNCLKTLSSRTAVPLKLFQRLLGHMATAAAKFRLVCSIWDRFSTGSMAESRGGRGNAVLTGFRLHRLPQNLQPVDRSFVPSGRSAPGTGLQACCGIHGCLRHRLGSHVQRARSLRGMDGSPNCVGISITSSCWHYALPWAASEGAFGARTFWSVRTTRRPLRISTGKAVYAPIACCNSPATSSSGVRSIWGPFVPSTSQECSTRWLTSCLERHFLGSGDSIPRRSSWLELVRSCSGRPVCISRNHPLPVVLLPNRGNARHRCTGSQLAPGPAQVCVPPSEPTSTDTVQDQGGWGAGLVSGFILAQQDLVPRTHAPRDSPSLADSSEEGSAFSETGHPLAPTSRLVETPCVVPGRDAEVLGDLLQEVALTIASARAPSTRWAYALKWNLFIEWCSSHREDPRRCSIRAVLPFLQQGLEHRLPPSTLKVYVAAISAHHDPIEGRSVGKHDLVVRFLRGARRLNPPRPPSLPSWDLALVLRALQIAPLSLCCQSSWSFSLWKPYSWLRWPRSRGWGTCRHFRSMNHALSLGRLTPVQHWDPGPAMCPRFLPLPSGTRWWTCKRCPWRRQTQP